MVRLLFFFFPVILYTQPIVIEIEGPSPGKVYINVDAEKEVKERIERMLRYFGEVGFDKKGIPVTVRKKEHTWEILVYRERFHFKGTEDTITKKSADLISEKILGRKPSFSSMIVYTEGGTGRREVYITNPDGLNSMKVSKGCKLSFSPSWSPDGASIVFICYMRRRPDVFMLDLKNGIMKPFIVTDSFEATPVFSPDGKWVVYASSHGGKIDLFLYDVNTGEVKRLTSDDYIDISPSFSGDGRLLAFTSNRGGSPGIFIMNLETGKVKRITSSALYATEPEFSPDGSKVVYTILGGNRTSLYIYEMKNGKSYRISPPDVDCEGGSFAPSGELIVASCRKNGEEFNLYVLDLKTGNFTPLFDEAGVNRKSPSWSPSLW